MEYLGMLIIVSILLAGLVILSRENYTLIQKDLDNSIDRIKLKKEIKGLEERVKFLKKGESEFVSTRNELILQRNSLEDNLKGFQNELLIEQSKVKSLQEKLNKANKELADLKDFKRKIDDAYSVGTYCKPIHDHAVEKGQAVGVVVSQGCGKTPKFTKWDRT